MLKRSLLYVPPFVVWMLYWAAFFPGMMNGDSIHSWAEIVLRDFDESQTGFLPIVYAWLAHAWNTPGSISLAQILLMMVLLHYVYAVLRSIGASFGILAGVAAYFTLSPFIATSLVTIIKDTPSGMLQLALLLASILILETNGAWLERRRNVVVLAATLTLMCLVRHEGWISAATFVGCLFLFFRAWWKPISAVSASAVVAVLLVQGPLFWAYHVSRDADIETVIMQSSEIAVVYSTNGTVTPAEAAVLDTIEPRAAWTAGYDPYTLNNVIFFNPRFSIANAYAHRAELASVWKPIALRNWRLILESRKTLGALTWSIVEPPGSFTYAVHVQAVAAGIDPNPYGLHLTHPVPGIEQALRALVAATSQPEWNWLFYRPALYLYLIAGSFALLLYERRRLDTVLLIAPLAGRIALIALFALSPDSRFFFYAFLLAPVMVAYAVVKRRGVTALSSSGSSAR